MKNLFSFFQKKTGPEETYLGLFLKEEEGVLFYIEKNNGTLGITAKEKFVFTDGWKRLVEDVDEALNRLEISTGKSPEKTIFFVYSHLVDPQTKEIKKQYLHRIKEVVKNLEFKPLGYIECHEAVVEYLEKKEEMTLNSILVEFDKTSLGVFVYKIGRLIFSEMLSRTGNLIDDLLPVFEKAKRETVLPMRIVLYDSKDLDIESANLLTHQWGTDFFVQLPRVQIVKEEQLIESLIEIFSRQMIGSGHKAMTEEKKPEQMEVMGFRIGDDVGEKQEKKEQLEEEITVPAVSRPKPARTLSSVLPLALFSKIKTTTVSYFNLFISRIRSLPFPVLPAIGGALIIFAIFLLEYFFHTAKLTVFFPSQNLSKDLTIIAFDTPTQPQQSGLALRVATDTAAFSASKATTGQRSIGEKAKGTVTMLNYDSTSSKAFDKGTTIQAQGLKFVITDNVTAASSSIAPDLSLQPGKSNVSITASDIGPDFNLAKGQRFQIDSFPTNQYLATNDNSFSGGSKRQVRSVSKDDAAAVKDQILSKAKEYTTSTVQAKLDKDSQILSQLSTYDLGEVTVSKNEGDEADAIDGKAHVKITNHMFKSRDLLNLFDQSLKDQVKSGFQIDDTKTKYEIKKISRKNSNYTLETSLKTKAVQNVDKSSLLESVAGKGKDSAQSILKDQYHANGFDLQVSNPIPFLKNVLPFFQKNIELSISYN